MPSSGYGHQPPASEMEKALAAAAKITAVPWQQKLLVLLAVRSYCPAGRIDTRLPLYLAHLDADPVLLRSVLLGLFEANGILVQAWAQSSLAYMAAQECVIQDLTISPPALFYWVRQLAYHRSIPSSVIADKVAADKKHKVMHGDTLFILPHDCAAEAGPWGYVIVSERMPSDWTEASKLVADLNTWRTHAKFLSEQVQGRIRIDSDDIPGHGTASKYLRRGHLCDAAIARQLEPICGVDGFLDAVRQSWALAVGQWARAATTRERDAVIFRYLLDHVATGKTDCGKGFREDSLAKAVRDSDPQMFCSFDQTALGKVLSRRGIGSVSRHGFDAGEDVGSCRIFRSVVCFSDDDKKRMEEIANELPG